MSKFPMNPNDRFIYDEMTGRMYSPNGLMIKIITCPKAKHWNQLIINPDDNRTRGCTECSERVLDLDKVRVTEALDILHLNPETCVHASSNSDKVIFLNPRSDRINHNNDEDDSVIEIETSRDFEEINRYTAMGYWPDVRTLEYNSKNKILKDGYLRVIQDIKTGQLIKVLEDHPRNMGKSNAHYPPAQEVIPATRYYSGYQPIPLAAYLIPKDIPNGTEVIVKDPIEDIINVYERAFNVPAMIIDRKVKLLPHRLEPRHVVG